MYSKAENFKAEISVISISTGYTTLKIESLCIQET